MKNWRLNHKFAFTFSVTAGLLLCVPAHAENPNPQSLNPNTADSVFHNLRYEDDFSPGAATPPEAWLAPIKYMPLATGDYGPTYLGFGGEIRERYEGYNHIGFGTNGAPSRSDYLLQRIQLHADLHVTDWLRGFVQLGDMRIKGARGVASTTDSDHLDVNQAFAEIKLPSPFGDAPHLRYGREELSFGSQRLIAVREGPNTRRAFDGLRLTDKIGDGSLDVIHVRPVADNPGTFDDSSNLAQQLTGLYATTPKFGVTRADLYALHYTNGRARYRGITAQENRDTFGVRLFGEARGFDWNVEATGQTGRFNGQDIRASMLAAAAGYKFEDAAWQPRLGFSANRASGDDAASGTIGTYNPLYVRLPYFAETALLVPSNIQDMRGVVTFNPRRDTALTFGYDRLWRVSNADGIYASGLSQYAGTAGGGSNDVGGEITADLRWNMTPSVQFGAILAEFYAGPVIQQALGKNVTYTVLFAKYRF